MVANFFRYRCDLLNTPIPKRDLLMKTENRPTLKKSIMLTALATVILSTLTLATQTTASALTQANAQSAIVPAADARYSVQLIKNCKLVSEYAMTNKQINAYKKLQAAELEMDRLEAPTDAIEDEIERLSERIETLSLLAIKENDDRVYIDKKYMAEQQEAVDELNAFMAKHNHSFSALNEQGRKIGKIARAFAQEIESNTPDIKYDQLHISTPENDQQDYHCLDRISGI